MTKKKEMRIKEVGATINLGNFSTLHVTVGESHEYAGLELQRTTSYLKDIADKVGGILNLPEGMVDSKKMKKVATPKGEQGFSFGTTEPIWYDHESHTYTDKDGNNLVSVTQFLSQYYPSNARIAKEYMDFAASFGNMVHTAIQNWVVGKSPKKELTKDIINSVASEMGAFENGWVEQFIAMPEIGLAGRFDILTSVIGSQGNQEYTLWDVKTNSDLFLETKSTFSQEVQDFLMETWNPNTIYGEHCLQLNLYAYIIEKTTGKAIDNIKIIHVPDGFNKIYDVPKIDVEKLLGMLNNG